MSPATGAAARRAKDSGTKDGGPKGARAKGSRMPNGRMPGGRTKARRPAWQEEPRALTTAGKVLALVLITVAVVAPFWVVLATSLSSSRQVTADGGYSLWPREFSPHAFHQILTGSTAGRALVVSLLLVVVGTAVSLAATVLLAYALARPGVIGGGWVLKMTLIAFLFPPGIIPAYLVVDNLGLIDSYPSLVLPVVVDVFNLVVLRGFFQGLPGELFEAARLDGAGEFTVLWRIVLPLSRSVIAVVGFFYGVTYWNDFFRALFYLNDPGRWPLSTLLRLLVTQGVTADANGTTASALQDTSRTTLMATIVLAVVPVLVVYPFVQRFFTKGVLTGAVKS
ncbi:carbohydrate ABC transporter permease [Streptomyces murinus]